MEDILLRLTWVQQRITFYTDISGFTEFVTNIGLVHRHHIIQELIEVLIDENEMGLEVSEIEGAAVHAANRVSGLTACKR